MITPSSVIRPECLLLGRTQKYAFEINNGRSFCMAYSYDPRTRLWAGTPRIMPVKFALSLLLRGFIASSQIWHEVRYPWTIFFGNFNVFGLTLMKFSFLKSLTPSETTLKKNLDRVWGQTEFFRRINKHAGHEGPRSPLPAILMSWRDSSGRTQFVQCTLINCQR